MAHLEYTLPPTPKDADGHRALAMRLQRATGLNCGHIGGLIYVEYPQPKGLTYVFPQTVRAMLGEDIHANGTARTPEAGWNATARKRMELDGEESMKSRLLRITPADRYFERYLDAIENDTVLYRYDGQPYKVIRFDLDMPVDGPMSAVCQLLYLSN